MYGLLALLYLSLSLRLGLSLPHDTNMRGFLKSFRPKRDTSTSTSRRNQAKTIMSNIKATAKSKIPGSKIFRGRTQQRPSDSSRPKDLQTFISNVSDPMEQLNSLNFGGFFHLKCQNCRPASSLQLNEDLCSERAQYCKKCRIWTCGGCGKTTTAKESGAGDLAPPCCEAGQLFRIWAILGKFDKKMIDSQLKHNVSRSKTDPTNKKQKSGIGYGGRHDPYDSDNVAGDFKDFKPVGEADADSTVSLVVEIVAKELTLETKETLAFHTLVLNLFRHSLLFDSISNLLRNDSLDNITERYDLYEKLFAFLTIVSGHDELCKIMVCPRPCLEGSPGLWQISNAWYKIPDEMRHTVLVNFENTYRQALTFSNLAEKHSSSKSRGKQKLEQERTKALTKAIVTLYDSLITNHKPTSDAATLVEANNPQAEWTTFMVSNKVTFTDEVLKFHRYATVSNLQKTSTVSGRSNRVSKEIANMMTSLPDNVFLRVAESRSDFMKVLIVGVEGSPYAGGLFPFDIHLDHKYPQSPPKMDFVLENVDNDMDGHPINPNLHAASGKVCLSILNTWDGDASQKWQPNKSTLLSVLVSVQAMILGAPCPYLNEPGRETHDPDSNPAVADTKRTQSKVVRRAIIPWLEKLKDPVTDSKDAIWREISGMYWKHHARAVQQIITEKWAPSNPALISYSKHENIFPAAKANMEKYNAVKELTKLVLWVETNPEALTMAATSDLAEVESLRKKRKRESTGESEDDRNKKWVYTGRSVKHDTRFLIRSLELRVESRTTLGAFCFLSALFTLFDCPPPNS
ncbi:hypothetical protein BJ878DRAFT_501981 [Calycina marina]|uniref:UBC core domain-containing protein n=1 Tax=Calycina marina TaxID=1763456 RepID=A0A9P7Z4Q4_9HELO|nr:hypothetical protein BJ878DRAFT_501981 [Calycina marina]